MRAERPVISATTDVPPSSSTSLSSGLGGRSMRSRALNASSRAATSSGIGGRLPDFFLGSFSCSRKASNCWTRAASGGGRFSTWRTRARFDTSYSSNSPKRSASSSSSSSGSLTGKKSRTKRFAATLAAETRSLTASPELVCCMAAARPASPVDWRPTTTDCPLLKASFAWATTKGTFRAVWSSLKKRSCVPQNRCQTTIGGLFFFFFFFSGPPRRCETTPAFSTTFEAKWKARLRARHQTAA
mmetsp:Transcript_21213/g.68445  ORF Transcript_21213/g.68445 Transcript_21213/m.68445 type:complete len:243 (-) Transcript_21213:629-1357(-)